MSSRRARRSVALVAGVAATWQVGPAATWLTPVRRRMPALSGYGRPDHVALTFDDGPRPRSTPRVLDTLATLGIRATFFVLGEALTAHPALGREVAAAGHELAVHGWDHGYLLGRRPGRVRDELARARDLVADVAGAVPIWFRPAYGVLTGPSLVAARALGLRPVLWSTWARDWTATASAESILARLTPGLTGGATVLLHDAGPDTGSARHATVAALPRIASLAHARGLTLGPLTCHGVSVDRGWR